MPFTGYRITSSYGNRKNPFGSGTEFHQGIDLVKSHKAPINAFVGGTVLYAGLGQTGSGFGGYGVVVFIKDRNGRGHLYAHLDSVSVKTGAKVSKGQTVGTQGATGKVTGSHLHYEIRKATSPSYGWSSNRQASTLEPTAYLKSLESVSKPTASKPSNPSKTISQMADEVLAGKHGDGHNNRRKSLGVDQATYNKVKDEVNKRANQSSKPKTIKVGSKVKIKSTASKYATGQTIPVRIKGNTYTVQQIKSDRALLKEIVSWVRLVDLD